MASTGKQPASKEEPAQEEETKVEYDGSTVGTEGKDTKLFLNGSKSNIFTEAGRVRPGQRCYLTADQAKGHKGLEPCQ